MSKKQTEEQKDSATASKYKTMTLSECAKFDHDNKLKDKLTGWGRVSADRRERGISRKARRERAGR